MNNNIARISRIFIIPLAILGVLDIVLIVVLISRLTATTQAREHEVQQLKNDQSQLQTALKPFQDIDKKLPAARKDVKQFYEDRMFDPQRYSEISEELYKLSHEQGIQLSSVVYNAADTTGHSYSSGTLVKSATPGSQGIQISTAISGDYIKLVKFINALERDKLFFIVEKLSLAGQNATQGTVSSSNQNQGTVSLQISLLTYMRKT